MEFGWHGVAWGGMWWHGIRAAWGGMELGRHGAAWGCIAWGVTCHWGSMPLGRHRAAYKKGKMALVPFAVRLGFHPQLALVSISIFGNSCSLCRPPCTA